MGIVGGLDGGLGSGDSFSLEDFDQLNSSFSPFHLMGTHSGDPPFHLVGLGSTVLPFPLID